MSGCRQLVKADFFVSLGIPLNRDSATHRVQTESVWATRESSVHCSGVGKRGKKVTIDAAERSLEKHFILL